MEIQIDRALVSPTWLNLFPMTELNNLEDSSSDHSPIFLEPMIENRRPVKKMFRFENAWLTEPM